MPDRMLRESIITNKKINSLSDFQYRVWIHLILYADDYGRGSADPEVLKGQAFTCRKRVTIAAIANALADLASMGCISLYEVDGKSYFCFPNWGAHQRIQSKYAKFPAPMQKGVQVDSKPTHTHAHTHNIKKEVEVEVEVEVEDTIAHSAQIDAHFERLWALYPNKKGKSKVTRQQKEALFAIPFEEAERAIGRYTDELKRDSWRRPQYGGTFFGGGYVDYLDNNYAETPQPKGRYDFDALQKQAFAAVNSPKQKGGGSL